MTLFEWLRLTDSGRIQPVPVDFPLPAWRGVPHRARPMGYSLLVVFPLVRCRMGVLRMKLVGSLAPLLFFVVFLSQHAQADTSSSHETKDAKRYGNCVVFTLVDMFTDEVFHVFACQEETFTDKTTITIRTLKDFGLSISLSKGLQVHMEERIPVALRVDKGPLIRRDAHWSPADSHSAYILDDLLAHQLLHDLARGQRVAIQVGKERGHIRLDGSQRAIADFRQRAGLHSQQTLEIPTQRP